jgi:hypothetical protein
MPERSSTQPVMVDCQGMETGKSTFISALLFAEARALDLHSVAALAQAAEERVDERLVAQEAMPLVVVEVGGDDDGGAAAVPLLA